MSEKQVVDDALGLAQNVARIILNDSFRSAESGIEEVLLFGSTLTGAAHDVDILIIHKLHALTEYGMFTKYDKKEHRAVPDREAQIEDKRHYASSILESMGAPTFPDFFEVQCEIRDASRAQVHNLRNGDVYSGTLQLPYVGKIIIAATKKFRNVLDKIDEAVYRELKQHMVVEKVKILCEERSFDLDTVLDLHVMHRDLLSQGKADEDRKLAIQQCRDKNFWHTILKNGRLYNKESGKFTVQIEQRYAGAVDLFKPTK